MLASPPLPHPPLPLMLTGRKPAHPGSCLFTQPSLNPPQSTLAAVGGVGLGLVVTPAQAPQQQAGLLQKPDAEEYRWYLLPCGQPNVVMHGRP